MEIQIGLAAGRRNPTPGVPHFSSIGPIGICLFYSR